MLPYTGTISILDVAGEINGYTNNSLNPPYTLQQEHFRRLANKPSGSGDNTINLSDFYGKSAMPIFQTNNTTLDPGGNTGNSNYVFIRYAGYIQGASGTVAMFNQPLQNAFWEYIPVGIDLNFTILQQGTTEPSLQPVFTSINVNVGWWNTGYYIPRSDNSPFYTLELAAQRNYSGPGGVVWALVQIGYRATGAPSNVGFSYFQLYAGANPG